MNNKIKILNIFYRLEYVLPLTYILITGSIFFYQALVPNTSPPSMIGFNIRNTDWILAILSMPSWIIVPILTLFIDKKDLFESRMMIWSSYRNVQLSITWLFIITPFCYFFWGLLIRKGIEIYNYKNNKKPDSINTHRADVP